MLTYDEVGRIVTHALEKDLGAWDRDFLEDLAERMTDNFPGKHFTPTARQEEQLTRIKDQYLMAKPNVKKPPPQDDAPAKPGHNKGGFVGEQLRSFVERLEKLDEERSGISADIRDVMAEAKANGFDPKTVRRILKIRKIGSAEYEEQRALEDAYAHALGIIF